MASSSNCIFCDIISEKLDAKILYKDDEIIIIEDKFAAAKNHILVMPVKHIENAKHLKPEHKNLIEKMNEFGLKQMREMNGDLEDMRSGINWPPLNTVRHLHQHFISPATSLSFFRSCLFSPKNPYFVDTKYLLRLLSK